MKKILEINKVEFKSLKPIRFSLFIKSIMQRLGIIIALFIGLLGYTVTNLFVFNISVLGVEYLNSFDIKNFIKNEFNINTYSLKKHISAKDIEVSLLENFDEISMASVAIKGVSLVINIKEKGLSEILNSQEHKDIISNFNGRILSVKAISGESVVGAGDIVKIGDIMVKANVENINGIAKKIKPKAEIKAEVWLEEKLHYFDKTIITTRTGNVIKNKYISFMGLDLYSDKKENKFSKFEVETKENKFDNSILPIVIKNEIIYEIEEKEKFCPFLEEKEKIFADCKKNALQKLQDNDIITNEKFVVTSHENFTNVNLILTIERTIIV